MQQISDPYRALGVARSATDAEIKAAHRALVKRYHPDSGSASDTDRFLRVQEAYRVLSDPLLRKEWDFKHAPGPVRADRPAAPRARHRPPAPKPKAQPAQTAAPPTEPTPKAESADPRTQPRSSRAYTWSASEVPWWEETRGDKRSTTAGPDPQSPAAQPAPAAPKPDEPVFTQQDFDVYNRSSGAAWSSAARAYFRKGDQDLPRRGSFRHQGTQVVTAGRARSAAEAEAREARHRAAAAAAVSADTYATGQAATHLPGAHEGTTKIVRRSVAAAWPSLFQRFSFAFIAWLPIAAGIAVAVQTSGDELLGLVATVASLVVFILLPRIAYIAALATLLVLFIGGLFVGAILLSGGSPSVDRLAFYIGALLVVGYAGTLLAVAFGPSTFRPWSAR
jgi:curved DNA-binding protein CbpA